MAHVLALVEIAIIHIFLYALCTHDDSCSTSVIVRNIDISHILRMNASTAHDHGQLLRIEVIFRVCSETTTNRFLIIVFVLAYSV